MTKLNIYTDGSCSGNPGPGGWAAVGYEDGTEVFEITGHQAETTNNRMELVAVGRALLHVMDNTLDYSEIEIRIFTDSANVIGWLSQGWKRKDPNIAELCRIIDVIIEDNGLHVSYTKVKGHSTDAVNNRVDVLAVNARNEGIEKRSK